MADEIEAPILEAPEPAPVEATAAPEAIAPYPEGSVEQDVARALDRARDEHGRFTKSSAEAPEAAAPADKPIPTTTDTVKEPVAAAPPPVAGPPGGWSPEAKALYKSLPPAIQAAVSRREAEVADGFRQKSDEAKAMAPVRAILDEAAPLFAQLGRDAPSALRELLTFQRMFMNEPDKLIQHINAAHGRGTRQLAQTPTASASPAAAAQPARPNVANDPASLIQYEFNKRDAQSAIERFESNPANKYAKNQEVRNVMRGLLSMADEAGQSPTLQSLYDKAIWSVDSIRAELQADAAAKSREAAAAKVAASRSAAVSIRGSSPGGAKPASLANGKSNGNDVFDDVRAALASHAAR